MGNEDGIMQAFTSVGQNKTIQFEEGQFSFACGNEIALCLKSGYYTLNCDDELWNEVTKFMETKPDIKKIKTFWLEKHKHHDLNIWSNDWDDIK